MECNSHQKKGEYQENIGWQTNKQAKERNHKKEKGNGQRERRTSRSET